MSKSDDIAETRRRVYARDLFRCQYPGCTKAGNPYIEMAHRIAKSKANRQEIRDYLWDIMHRVATDTDIDEIIHSDLNLVTSCRLHNSYFNIGNNPQKMKALLRVITGNRKKERF